MSRYCDITGGDSSISFRRTTSVLGTSPIRSRGGFFVPRSTRSYSLCQQRLHGAFRSSESPTFTDPSKTAAAPCWGPTESLCPVVRTEALATAKPDRRCKVRRPPTDDPATSLPTSSSHRRPSGVTGTPIATHRVLHYSPGTKKGKRAGQRHFSGSIRLAGSYDCHTATVDRPASFRTVVRWIEP